MHIAIRLRPDFADTLAVPSAPPRPRAERLDPIEQLALADQADWTLLRLVVCAGSAILLLGTACSLLT